VTTALILVPVGGALWVWITPWKNTRGPGGLALLIALVELALWVGTAANFDFGRGGLQFQTDTVWFEDLGVSYHVGLQDFTLWLVGLTVLVTAAAIGYGFWVGRERPGAYLGLLLFLEGAVIGVFTAQDLLVFYVFWEAMLIPLYVLIGVWGGPGRLSATFKFVAYTMAGSLLMLVAIIAAGLSAGSFDLAEASRHQSVWIFLGFAAALRSRRRSGRSTAGFPTPTVSRPRRLPPCSRALSRRRPPTGSSPLRSLSFRARYPTGACRSSSSPRSASSTAHSSLSGRPISAASSPTPAWPR
jgi:hypothetical protein